MTQNPDDPPFVYWRERDAQRQEEGSGEGGVTSINLFAEKDQGCSDMISVEMHSIREADANAGDLGCGSLFMWLSGLCLSSLRAREWRSWSEQLTVLSDWEAGEVVHGNIHGCGNNAFEEAVIAAPFFAPQTVLSADGKDGEELVGQDARGAHVSPAASPLVMILREERLVFVLDA